MSSKSYSNKIIKGTIIKLKFFVLWCYVKRKIEEISVLLSYKEDVDKKLKEFENQMEEKRQKVKCKTKSK